MDPRAQSWHPRFIASLARKLKSRNYLEVGVYRGETFRKVAKQVENAMAIDIDPQALRAVQRVANGEKFLGTLQEFAITNPARMFDLVFIDANHDQKAVFEDFASAAKLTEQHGLILLHDTWPKNRAFSSQNFCGDAFIAVSRIRESFPEWHCVTLPIHPGLTICQRVSSTPDALWV